MQGADGLELRTMDLAARLASVVARPLDLLDGALGGLEPLSAAETRAIAAHPAFRVPFNRAIASTLRLSEIAIDREHLQRLAQSPRSRLATLLVSQKMDLVERAALHLAAAIVHRRVLKLTLKAERARIKQVLGEDGYLVATREAPLLHAVLAELDSGSVDAMIVESATAPAEARPRLIGLGLRALCGFVERVEPPLSGMMALRAEPALNAEPGRRAPDAVNDTHCDHIVRLVRRRVQPWAAIIG
jgi:hypothetical protein